MNNIHSLLFDKLFYTKRQSNAWVKLHGYQPIKPVHETKRYYRYRLTTPSTKYDYRTIKFKDGLLAVYQLL